MEKTIEDHSIKISRSSTLQNLTFKRLRFFLLASIIAVFLIASLSSGLTEKSFTSFKQGYYRKQNFDPFYNTPSENVNISIIIRSINTIPQIKHTLLNTNSVDKTLEKNIALQFGKYLKLKPKVISQDIDRSSFEKWIKEETDISLQNLKNNIADDNLNNLTTVYQDTGITEGTVLASPSQKNPDYFYDWIRDTAITMNTIVNVLSTQISEEKSKAETVSFDFSSVDVKLFGTIFKYMNKTYEIQRTENLSGEPLKQSLGEPKWNVDGSAFMGSWGRPQNDGPALRATSMIHFLDSLHKYDYSLQDVYSILEPTLLNTTSLVFSSEKDLFEKIVYYDLKFVVDNWQRESFDLWEELNGNHFFTSMVQLNSIRLGIEFLNHHLDWVCPSGTPVTSFITTLNTTYAQILNFIENEAGFVDKLSNHIIENPQYKYRRSGLDISTLIASILTHDAVSDTSNNSMPFNYNNTLILNSLHGLSKSMQVLYPINHALNTLNMGVSLGRYPEDIYNGNGESEGNPWFLATASGAQLLYGYIDMHLKNKMDLQVDVAIDEINESFWHSIFDFPLNCLRDIDANFNLVIPYGSKMYIDTLQTLMNYADSFLDQIRKHVSDQGNMSEQYNKYNGYQEGAKDLTWSYGTFWNTAKLRNNVKLGLQEIEKLNQKP